jgi:hypothetical protein
MWRGEMHEVIATGNSYIYRGLTYTSLSRIAREITGTRWSGPLFFGVRKPRPLGFAAPSIPANPPKRGWNMERPGLKKLLDDIATKRVDTVVVYKVDRLTRSLADFAKIVEQFDKQGISFVSVTQQFNTTTSMGRLTLNVLLSFAQ